MITATKSRGGVKVVVFGAAVLLAAVSPIGQRIIKTVGEQMRSETQDRAVFSITFKPDYRPSGIHIVGMAEGVEFHNDIHPRPATIATWIPKGARAYATADQMVAGTLSCTAQLNGVIVDSRTIDGVGSVQCWVNGRTPAVR